MDAGVFDVLHDAANHYPLSVGDGVDVGLEGVLEESVDEHRPVFADARGRLEIEPQRVFIIDDLHCTAA